MEIRNLRIDLLKTPKGKRVICENIVFSMVSGFVFYRSPIGVVFIFILSIFTIQSRIEALNSSEKSKNTEAFVDLLKVVRRLSAAGMSLNSCFQQAENDLHTLYPDNQAWVMKSLKRLNAKIGTDPHIADHLIQWGKEEGLRDIVDFGRIILVIQSYGGNVSEKLSEITTSMTQRIETERQIWVLASSKIFEQRIMFYLGYIMILLLNTVMPEVFGALYSTFVGRIVMTFSYAMMLLGKRVGMHLTRIEV